jgi:outer membrane protein TolC
MTFPRFPKSALALSVALTATGCYLTPGDFERSADREVDQILAEGTRAAVAGREESVLRPKEIQAKGEAEPQEASDVSGPKQAESEPARGQDPVEEPLRPVRVLTLTEALEIAVTTGRDYVTRREGLYLTALGISGTRFDFGPRLSGALSYVFADSESGPISQDANLGASLSHVLPFGGNVSASGSTASARNSGSGTFSSGASIRLTQPLLRGFGHEIAYEALTQAERNLIYAIRDFELFREGYSIRIARDYYNLVQTKREVENQGLSLERLNFQRRKAEALYEVDRAKDLDVVRARRDELNSENALIQAQEEYEARLDSFRIALGLPKTQPVDVRPEDPEFVPVNFDRQSAIEVAYANRLDYLTQKDRIEDSARSLRISRNALLPSLSLDGGYNLSGGPDASFLEQSIDDASWSVGLSLDLPLQQLPERNAWRSAQISHNQALRSFEEFEDTLAIRIQASLRSIARLKNSVDIQQELIVDQERALRVARIKFEAGETPIRDVSEAEESLLGAQNSLIQSKVDYEIQRLQLLSDLGILFIDEQGMFKE